MDCCCPDRQETPSTGYYELGEAGAAQRQQIERDGSARRSTRERVQEQDSARAREILGSAAGTFHIPAGQLTIHFKELLGKGTSAR